jgi:hypothetical protein
MRSIDEIFTTDQNRCIIVLKGQTEIYTAFAKRYGLKIHLVKCTLFTHDELVDLLLRTTSFRVDNVRTLFVFDGVDEVPAPNPFISWKRPDRHMPVIYLISEVYNKTTHNHLNALPMVTMSSTTNTLVEVDFFRGLSKLVQTSHINNEWFDAHDLGRITNTLQYTASTLVYPVQTLSNILDSFSNMDMLPHHRSFLHAPLYHMRQVSNIYIQTHKKNNEHNSVIDLVREEIISDIGYIPSIMEIADRLYTMRIIGSEVVRGTYNLPSVGIQSIRKRAMKCMAFSQLKKKTKKNTAPTLDSFFIKSQPKAQPTLDSFFIKKKTENK